VLGARVGVVVEVGAAVDQEWWPSKIESAKGKAKLLNK
jgi:hypothetical protein